MRFLAGWAQVENQEARVVCERNERWFSLNWVVSLGLVAMLFFYLFGLLAAAHQPGMLAFVHHDGRQGMGGILKDR